MRERIDVWMDRICLTLAGVGAWGYSLADQPAECAALFAAGCFYRLVLHRHANRETLLHIHNHVPGATIEIEGAPRPEDSPHA